ncbi:MAG TPA: YbhB/YbcL family Raf kinase inhibitor-like protein [Acidimicrobiia bacterium]|nr:YbhB/YbcL family Raf kinase inhibitor-like protein [Acidimicrobiia bacterium]
MRRTATSALAALIATIAVVGAVATPAGAAKTPRFHLSSPAFASGAAIPDGFTCDGAGASPPLQWTGVPRKAAQLALIVDDPDAPNGTFVHWVAWNIDPKAGELPEQNVLPTVVQGSNGVQTQKYLGPCPPRGDDPHHYRFTLYALSKAPSLQAGATAAELRRAIRRTVLARTRLVGTYQRKATSAT